ncbi:hypothetical protein Poly24_02560 [Rosistilla carotiformis]|uniref:Uncharacterized protein n=1 Tax=Rosistilla carotiformis TaxID=2528017 RepID=A0A518JLZ9_9BACT|nr:hypothetical protein [Rosistilla carotiformis]QDV66569.1 hypothetical protein Poly24_02560 [Rosistilla carotiformis]
MSNQEQIDRCRLYLLDELQGDDLQAFELQMQSSPELLECIAQQADLLVELGEACQSPAEQPIAAPLHASTSFLRVAGAVASLAALVLFVIWFAPVGHAPQASRTTGGGVDDALVAHAWAENRVVFRGDDLDVGQDATTIDFDTTVDEVPSWLSLGVAQVERTSEPEGIEGADRERS